MEPITGTTREFDFSTKRSSGIEGLRDSRLRLRDLILDHATGVYVPALAASGSFAYTDGPEVEKRLLQIVKAATDRGSMSEELEKEITDWPSQYHLSRQRADLLRALDWLPRHAKVLELGAGCGALTRYLGECFRKVDAVEGSLLRAQIAKERCGDLANVHLYASPFQNVKFSPTYDIVTLIGVLEYAAMLNDGPSASREDAWLSTLKLGASALRRNGVLILAVENPLGLKYWSGCGEDHTGRLFDGIHGYPNPKSPVTFSEKQIESLLRRAGLNHFTFYYPFPDYKFTRTIIRDTPIPPASLFLHNWIEIPFYDYAGKRDYYIHEGLAVRQLCRAGLLHEFANSFLVLASKSQTRQLISPWVARRQTSQRARWYQCVTSLYADPKPRIEKTKLDKSYRENPFISQRWSRQKWKAGDLETFSLDEALFQVDPFTAILEVVKRYRRCLLSRFSNGSSDDLGYPLLRGDSFDFTFWNVIWDDHAKQYEYIDDEWKWKGVIPIDYMLFRSLYYYLLSRRAYVRALLPRKDAEDVLLSLIRQLYPQYDSQRNQENRLREERVQTTINDRASLLPSLSGPIAYRLVGQRLKDPLGKLLLTYAARPDLQSTFPEVDKGDYSRLLDWAKEQAVSGEDSAHQLLASDSPWYEANPWHSLSELSEELNQARAELSQRESKLEVVEAEKTTLSEELNQVRAGLEALKHSFGYKLMKFYAPRIDRLFPEGSRRGEFRKIVVKSIGIATEEGLTSLVTQATAKLRRREFHLAEEVQVHQVEPDAYARWIAENEPTDDDLLDQRKKAKEFRYQPLISIVTPVWNPPSQILRDTIESVLSQTYENWELCIADGSSQEEVKELLRDFTHRTPKMRVKFLEENLGISGNSNAALELCRGEFIALLDHDDMLSPFALYEIVQRLNEQRDLGFIYTDKDRMTLSGSRHEPLFKPDWSPDIMLSANYVTHLCVIRKQLIDSLGGFRPETDGAQDWDLFLRVSEKTDRISHIPKVMYHWREAPASVSAAGLRFKPYATKAQLLALNQHLQRTGREGEAYLDTSGWLRVSWKLTNRPLVSIVIPLQQNEPPPDLCVQSIGNSSYGNLEILVVGERKHFPTVEITSRINIRVIEAKGRIDFPSACNLGAAHAKGEVLIFLNPNCEVLTKDWLEEMVGWTMQPDVGAAGVQLLSPDGTICHGGMVIGLPGYVFEGAPQRTWCPYGYTEWYRNYLAVSGACLATATRTFKELGGFREGPQDVAAADYCLRARDRRRRVVYTPHARLTLRQRAKKELTKPEHLAIPSWDQVLLGGDPYFNPNLSYNNTIPEIKVNLRAPTAIARTSVTGIPKVIPALWSGYSHDARLISERLDFDSNDLEMSIGLMNSHRGPISIGTINWFIPDFDNVFWGGIHTIFRFAAYFKRAKGVANRMIVFGLGRSSPHEVRAKISRAFPELSNEEIFILDSVTGLDELPAADASFCTLWTTAYMLLKFNKTKRKFYFLQDFEPLFYPAGSTSAQVEATYRFGFYGIANTVALKKIYESDYAGKTEYFTPCVDVDVFHPAERPKQPFTVFFYARPNHPRNCFELGSAALKRFKSWAGPNARILAAGSAWDPGDFGLDGVVEQLGLLGYEETADLYRKCDAGLVFMMTRHPSYIPFELMASGCLVITNHNPHTTWLLKNEENCLLTNLSAGSISETLKKAYLDNDLRKKIVQKALSQIRSSYANWGSQYEKVFEYMCNPTDSK